MKDRTPPFFGFQVDVIFGVEETRPVGAVIGTANLIHHVGNLRKTGHDKTSLVGDCQALLGSCGRSKRAAYPQRSLIQVRQELGTDDVAEQQEEEQGKPQKANTNRKTPMMDGPLNALSVADS